MFELNAIKQTLNIAEIVSAAMMSAVSSVWIAYVRFTMDRSGRVLAARIEKTSDHDLLDQETLALIQRAQPLPKPPAEVPSNRLVLVVLIEFFLHGQN